MLKEGDVSDSSFTSFGSVEATMKVPVAEKVMSRMSFAAAVSLWCLLALQISRHSRKHLSASIYASTWLGEYAAEADCFNQSLIWYAVTAKLNSVSAIIVRS